MDRPKDAQSRFQRVSWVAISLAAGGCVALNLSGCAPSRGAGLAQTTPGSSRGSVEKLRQLAAAETTRPDQAAAQLPPPPGIDALAVLAYTPAQLAPGSPITITLDAYLAEVRALSAPPAYGPIKAGAVDPERETAAMKAYAAGRDLLAQGKSKEAIPLLTQATKDAPASPEPWRSLAEANLAEGKRSAAMSALQQAVRRGLLDAASVRALARDAMQSARVDDAIWLFVRALDLSKDKSADGEWDRALTRAFLADALDQAGFAAASAELYAQDVPALSRELSASAKLRADAAEVIRRRGETLQRAGDLNLKLGRFAPAMDLYAKASGEPSLDPGALVSRRVYAALRLGRPAAGAVALIDKLQASHGLVEERELALIRYLCGGTSIGPALSAALDETFAQGATSPSVKSRIVRARAAALSAPDRRAILIEHLASDAGDSEAASDLLATFGERDLRARDEGVLDLIRRNPAAADAYATIMLSDGRGVFAAAERLSNGSQEPEARLLRPYLLVALGKPREALSALSGNDVPASLRVAWLTARCEIAGFGGDYLAANEALLQLRAIKDAGGMFISRALVALQSLEEAADVVEREYQTGKQGPADALASAGVLLRASRADKGEEILIKLVEADPFDEKPAELLINIYGRGAKPDQQKFIASLRRLREAVPSSRVLRWAAANELVQRSQWSQAESSLLSLAEEDATSVGLLDLLATVWIRGGTESMARGEAWLTKRMASAPESIEVIAALARVMAVHDKAQGAIALIDEKCAKWPIPRLQRIKEAITSETLKDAAKARELAMGRLAAAPRPVDDTLELCELLLGEARIDQIEPTLRAGLPKVLTLLSSQEARLVRIISLVAQKDAEQVAKGATPIAPGLLTFAIERGLALSPALHEARVVILSLAEPPDIAAIAAAYKGATPQGDKSGAIAERIASRLVASPKPRCALTFGEVVVTSDPEPPPQTLLMATRLIWTVGNVDDLRRLLPVLTKGDRAELLLSALLNARALMPMPDRRPAQLIYEIAGRTEMLERKAEAMGMYEYLLKDVDPQHGMAANDYGYLLLEDDIDRAKATRFLQLAFILEPEDDSVLDSVGWLRYKQGRLADDKQDGGPDGIGAISLLSKAVKRMGSETNPTILDHYGDALWLSGRKEEAQAIWRKSLADVQMEIDTINADARAGQFARRMKFLITLKPRLQDKLDAVRAGKEPPVAPRWEK